MIHFISDEIAFFQVVDALVKMNRNCSETALKLL